MGDFLQKIKNQIDSFWKNSDKKKKIKLSIISVIIIISITALIYFTTKTRYETLYKDLSLKDAGLITQKLDDMAINWKDENGGTTILVPQNMKDKIKIQLATEGLPKDGYSILDALNDSSWTMTEAEKKERLKYALQNELSETISNIDGIDDSKVYIDIPQENSFLKDNGQATASVFIKLSRGIPLSSENVLAIKNLVASSFKNMKVENVTVTDDSGKMYVANNESNEDYNFSNQMSSKLTVESKINNSIKKFLGNIFGYSNVDVRANVKINFNSEVRNEVIFSPPVEDINEGLVRSMEKIEESTIDGVSGGVAGVESNTNDTTDYSNVDQDNSKYSKSSKVINYELNEINRQIKKVPGEIQSLTVAILINEDILSEDGLTDEKRKEIEELVFAATGLETEKVKVSSLKFNSSIPNEVNNQFNQTPKGIIGYISTIPMSLIALIIILLVSLVIIGFVIYRRRKLDQDISKTIDDEIRDSEEIEEIDFDKETSQYKAQVKDFVEKKPESVAQLLRSWINEE